MLRLNDDAMDVQSPLLNHPHKTIGSFSAFVLTVNYVVGTGIFSLPYGFYSAGLLLGSLCLLISAIFSMFSANMVLEVLARTEGIKSSAYDEGFSSSKWPINVISLRKFDFTTLLNFYYSLKGKLCGQLVISLYCYGALWAYTAVFASSVSSIFFQFALGKSCNIYENPTLECNLTYYLCIVIYAMIVVPLACRDLEEQAVVQVFLAGYRLLAYFVMVGTVSVALMHPNPYAKGELVDKDKAPYIAFDTTMDWSGFSSAFSASVVALTFHYNLPDIVAPVRNKVGYQKVMMLAIFTIVTVYYSFGFICASFFGDSTLPLVTLNWTHYTGVHGGWGETSHRPAWAAVIQLVVQVFPIFDMLSVFPLVGVTLGNNILASSPTFFREGRLRGRKAKIITRLVATIPPIILGAFLGNLSKIFGFTALAAFFLEFVFPCILQYSSKRLCSHFWGKRSEVTPYSTIMGSLPFVFVTLVFSAVSFIFAFLALAYPKGITYIFH